MDKLEKLFLMHNLRILKYININIETLITIAPNYDDDSVMN